MNHSLVKTILITDVIEMISKHCCVTLDEARRMFYKSKTALLLADDTLGLYGESALFVFSLFEKELTRQVS